MKLSARSQRIAPFYVMDLLAQARAMEANGQSVVHMEIGEPDFVTPDAIIAAGQQALSAGKTFYTPALGLPELRAAISADYAKRFGVAISAERIAITPGASGALLLVMALLAEPGSAVMLADPGYPCNRHFVELFNGDIQAIPVDASSDFQLTAEIIAEHWQASTRVVMLASPSNPSGTLVSAEEVSRIAELVHERRGVLVVDEIYQNLVYEREPETVLAIDPSIWVVNSFSKYFGMTGWRLGWLVVPEEVLPAVDRLSQNVFLAASTIAQHAALAALEEPTQAELERRRAIFQQRRDYLLPALQNLGFRIEGGPQGGPQGAFYLYADCSRFSNDSFGFAQDLLKQAGVAVTPGLDFGKHRASQYLRFAYTTSMEQLQEGVARLQRYLGTP